MRIAILIISIIGYLLLSAAWFMWTVQSINHEVPLLAGRLAMYGMVVLTWAFCTWIISLAFE